MLAKIDVDANPRIAQAFRVQGIPMVFAVVGGQPVDAFTGVIPEAQLRPWIDAVRKAGGGEVQPQEDPVLVAADDALVAGDLDEAERGYKKILAERPADKAAEAGLAQVGLLRRVEGVDPDAALAAAAAAPDDLAAQILAADVEVIGGQAERAYARLIDLVRRSAGEDREKAREHLVSLFSMAARTTRRSPPRGVPSRTRCSEARCAGSPSSTPPRTWACGHRHPAPCRAARRRPARCATTACWPGSALGTPAATRRRGSTPASGSPATA